MYIDNAPFRPYTQWEPVGPIDYETSVPDAGGFGVRLRLTIHEAERRAVLFTIIDDEHGEQYARGETPVPYTVACAMVER